MRNVLGRLLILAAEALDRSLLTVPEIDEYDSPCEDKILQAFTEGCRDRPETTVGTVTADVSSTSCRTSPALTSSR
jgi:hypothetical protein